MFKHSLSLQMLIAVLIGIFMGLFLGDLCSVFGPWENAYIMILKVTTIPYLICAVMHGIGRLGLSTAKNILHKGLIFISCMWAINIIIIYVTVYLFPTSKGITYSAFSTIKPSAINFADLLIPDNIFAALSHNLIPAVVVFGILVGISLMHIKEKQPFMGVLDTLVNSLTTITGWISRITPIGTFLIIADRVGTIQLDTVKQIGTYLVLYILGITILALWIVPRIVGMLTIIPAKQWIKSLGPLMLVAFTTNLVIVTLPFLIELIKREAQHYYHKDDSEKSNSIGDQIQSIVSVIYNLPLGSLFIAVFIFFVSTFYNIPLSGDSQIQLFLTTFLTSLGAIGLGSWINSLNFLLDTLGLPLLAIDTYLATLPFTAGFQSMVSVMEIASLSLLIALACHGLLKWDWRKISKQTVVILIPVFAFIVIFKSWIHLPPIANHTKGIYEISIAKPIEVKTYRKDEALPEPRSGDVLDRILSSKLLRVGYNPEAIPFCFPNEQGELVGYDMAFAYTLAKDLQCDLELVPINLSRFDEELKSGLYDVAMSSVTINEDRLRKVAFSSPYLESHIAFIMKKKYKKKYTSVSSIIQDNMNLVVRRGSAYEQLARSIAPENKIVTVETYQDYITQYPDDVLLRGEFQQISWSLTHPEYAVVFPDPEISKDVFGYATAQGADKFLCYLNLWMDLKKNEKLTSELYNIWILGRTDMTTTPERRWSIIRNVFGWTDN
ncbi:MAG: cation:dicarboxylase symporter family transporter [Rhabdochlamydiaceae bacterium]